MYQFLNNQFLKSYLKSYPYQQMEKKLWATHFFTMAFSILVKFLGVVKSIYLHNSNTYQRIFVKVILALSHNKTSQPTYSKPGKKERYILPLFHIQDRSQTALTSFLSFLNYVYIFYLINVKTTLLDKLTISSCQRSF